MTDTPNWQMADKREVVPRDQIPKMDCPLPASPSAYHQKLAEAIADGMIIKCPEVVAAINAVLATEEVAVITAILAAEDVVDPEQYEAAKSLLEETLKQHSDMMKRIPDLLQQLAALQAEVERLKALLRKDVVAINERDVAEGMEKAAVIVEQALGDNDHGLVAAAIRAKIKSR